MQLSFAPVVKQVTPAVVNVYATTMTEQGFQSPFANDPFFSQFFGGGGMFQSRPQTVAVARLGRDRRSQGRHRHQLATW